MAWLTQGYRDDNFLSSISFSSSSSSQMKVSCYVLQLLITWVGNLTSQSLPSWLLGETDIWILKEDSMLKSANPLSIIIIKKLEKKSNVGKSLTRERYNTWRCSPVLQYFMFSGSPTETCCFQPDESILNSHQKTSEGEKQAYSAFVQIKIKIN